MDEMIFAALHVLFANQGAPLSVKSRVISNRGFTRGKIPSVIETYRNTFQSLMQVRGSFAVADPSVRRLRRPVAGRLTRGDRILRH